MRNRYSKILCLLLLFACCLPQGRLGLRRLTAFRQQVSADLPPNRTYMFPCIRLSINNINLFAITMNRMKAIFAHCKRLAVPLNHQFMPFCVWP